MAGETIIEADVERLYFETTAALEAGTIDKQHGIVMGTSGSSPKRYALGANIPRASEFGYISSSYPYSVTSEAAMLALAAWQGDTCTHTAGTLDGKTYQLKSNSPSTLADWVLIAVTVGGSTALPANEIGFGNATSDGITSSGNFAYDATNGVQSYRNDTGVVASFGDVLDPATLTYHYPNGTTGLELSTRFTANDFNTVAGLYRINGQQHTHTGANVTGVTLWTGFDNPDNVTRSYNPTTRVLTLSGTAKLYYQGVVILDLASGNHVSAARANTEGLWFYVYNGAYGWSTTPWSFDEAQLGIVFHNATGHFGVSETHGVMQPQSHENDHFAIGTYRLSGGLLANYTLNSTTATNRRPSISQAVLKDEDLKTTIAALAANGPYTRFTVAASSVPTFTIASTEFVGVSGGVPRWNNAATGALTTLSNNQYMNVWVVSVPTTSDTASTVYSRLFVAGQSASGTRTTIDAEVPSGVSLGTFGNMSQEDVFTTRILIRASATDWTIVSVNDLTGTQRQQGSNTAAAPVVLGNLGGGSLGLIPIGVDASSHTTYDGSTGPVFSFTPSTGARISANDPEALHLVWPNGTAAQKAGMCYELTLADGITPQCYAETWGEIVSNGVAPTATVDGAFVIKTPVAGVMTEQARFVGGESSIAGSIVVTAKLSTDSRAISFKTSAVAVCGAIDSYGPSTIPSIGVIDRINSLRITNARAGGITISATEAAGYISLFTGGTADANERMRITANGKLGFGVVPNAGWGASIIAAEMAGVTIGTWASNNNVSSNHYYDGAAHRAVATGYMHWISMNPSSGTLGINVSNASVTAGASPTWVSSVNITNVIFSTGYARGINFSGTGVVTTAGDFAHDTTIQAHVGYSAGHKGWMIRNLFSMYSSVTLSNSTSATSILTGSATGSKSLTGAWNYVGKTYVIEAYGTLTTTSGGDITIAVKHKTSTVKTLSTRTTTLSTGETNIPWKLRAKITRQSTSDSAICQYEFDAGNTIIAYRVHLQTATAALLTTIGDLDIDVTGFNGLSFTTQAATIQEWM